MFPTAFKTKESKDLLCQNNVLSSIYKEGMIYEKMAHQKEIGVVDH